MKYAVTTTAAGTGKKLMAALGAARCVVPVDCARRRYLFLARSLAQSAVGSEDGRREPNVGESAFRSAP